MDLTKFDFPAHNAVFHIIKGLIFNRTIAFRVRALFPDKNDKNIPIYNEERLKRRLFEKIQRKYMTRLNSTVSPSKYMFTDEFISKVAIGNDKLDVFKLQLFQLSSGLDEEFETAHIGGDYTVFPLTFVCKKCGDLQVVRSKNIEKFDPNKCVRKDCNGEYEQLSLMLFCETCGNIRPFEYSYKGEPITLIRSSKDSIATWRVRAKSQESIDVFRLMCKHWDPFDFRSHREISSEPPSQQKPLTVTEGSIYIPVADTSIDIPASTDIDIHDLEYILNGISLGKFKYLSDLGLTVNLETVQNLYNQYNNPTSRELAFKTNVLFIGKSEEEKEQRWKETCLINKVEEVIEEIKLLYPISSIETLRELNDFSALVGNLGLEEFELISYSDYLNKIDDAVIKKNKGDEYENVRDIYKIESLIHIPSVTLVNSCYGIINGINKFYEKGFTPHFDPIWANRMDPNKGFYAYCYPYETEGIVLTLNKQEIIKWLYECRKISTMPENINDFFNSLEIKQEPYISIQTLLHTFSHLLMRNSSVFTGLDLQSYGELIFPTSAAIFLYSTSSINIGGLQFIFENEIFNWFEYMKFDVIECTLDPNCIKETGSCFSCMYIPEFVCSLFNQSLDRDVFIGKTSRYSRGFWE